MLFLPLLAVPTFLTTLAEAAAVVIVARVANDAYDKVTKKDDSEK